jgi:hypothetical protein
MNRRTAGRIGFAVLGLAIAATACSGQGPGASACRTIERARCDRQAECDDWSDETRDECRQDRDAICHAGAAPIVRDATEAEVDTCASAIRDAACDALDDPFALPGCEGLAAGDADGGTDAGTDAGPDGG